MMYGKVVNGEVVKYSNKPTSARTSNLWLNAAAMKSEGWLPVDDQKPELMPWQSPGARSETVMATKIKWTYTISEPSLDDFKSVKKKRLGQGLSGAIFGRGHSVEAQLNAANGVYPQAKAGLVKQEVKTLYDEFKSKCALIDAASTYQEVVDVYEPFVSFVPPEQLDENGHIIVEDPLV